MAVAISLANEPNVSAKLGIDLLAAPFPSIAEPLGTRARGVRLAPYRHYPGSAIIIEKLRMPEIDAGVDEPDDHSFAGDRVLQWWLPRMGPVGRYMMAYRILFELGRHRQIKTQNHVIGCESFECLAWYRHRGNRSNHRPDVASKPVNQSL